MKIAISSTGDELKSEMCPRFGRADYFIIVDPETLEFEAVANPNIKAVGGAGIQSSQMVINHDAAAVLSGRVGMNAFRVLESAGIAVYENVEGSVQDAIELFNDKNVTPSNSPGPGRKRHQKGGGYNREKEFVDDAEEIIELRKEVDQLTKQLYEVKDKLNRLNK
ncbi:NifB/NifX family molybdenum-iron cluster-binding protein [Bacteroidota bacterium]